MPLEIDILSPDYPFTDKYLSSGFDYLNRPLGEAIVDLRTYLAKVAADKTTAQSNCPVNRGKGNKAPSKESNPTTDNEAHNRALHERYKQQLAAAEADKSINTESNANKG